MRLTLANASLFVLAACLGCAGLSPSGSATSQSTAPTPGTKKKPQPTGSTTQTGAPPVENRLDASRVSFRRHDLGLTVESAVIGKVALKSITGNEGTSKDPCLLITLRCKNHQTDKFLDWQSWGAQNKDFYYGPRPSLKDDRGNSYRTARFTSRVVGGALDSRIRPGQESTDAVVFEEPLASVVYLDLDIPLPDDGLARFRLPAAMLRR